MHYYDCDCSLCYRQAMDAAGHMGGSRGVADKDADTLREALFRMAEDVTRIKRVCTQEHPPKMASPTRDWEAGTETRHSDGTRCVLLNDGDWAVIPTTPLTPGNGDTTA